MKVLSTLAAAAVASILLMPAAKADDYDKFTKITVNDTVRLPNMTLQPGNYSLRLLDATGNRHVVQVRDENGRGLGFILALPNYRLVPRDKTVITYWETPPGQPKALRAWFYPGDNFGQEFAYPKAMAVQIAKETHQQVPTTYAEKESDLTTAPVGTTNEQGETQQQEVAQNTPPPAPAPAPEAERAAPPPPEPAPAPQPEALPKTASTLPLIGMLGLISLGGFFVVKIARSARS